jgi:hypothetical protein
MIQSIIAVVLLSHSYGNSSPCSGKIPLALNYSKDTIYTYQHKINTSTWTKNNEAELTNASNNFKTLIYPYAKTKDGYLIYEVVIGTQSNELLNLIGKRPDKLPQKYLQPLYPIGQVENAKDQTVTPIKQVACDQVFSSYESFGAYDESNKFNKKSLNKIIGTENVKMAGKSTPLIRMETRKEVTITGEMTGTGTETTTIFFIAGTNELYEQRTTFIYEYKTGYGKTRKAETMKGTYSIKLIGKNKYIKKTKSFPELTEAKNHINYHTNNNGIYIPVELNSNFKTKMYINTLSELSFIDYDYYKKNYDSEPKDYFYPFSTIQIGHSKIENPGIEILAPSETGLNLDFKIPGTIGKDIICMGALNIDDTKRQLVFWEPEEKASIPTKAVPFELINNTPIFELMVNGNTVKATIGFDSHEPEIASTLKQKLGLKTIKVAVPKGNNLLASFMYKTEIIITPANQEYFKTSAVVKDFGNAPYDIKLGLNYIKGKNFTIDYKNGWFEIK